MKDYLGTPFMQTYATGATAWRVDYEPYGRVYALRCGVDRHHPLRLPGQEAEQLNLGLNGATEKSYNIFRWYRPGWGRYSQADPLGNLLIATGFTPAPASWLQPYAYVLGRPIVLVDPMGLCSCSDDCPGGVWGYSGAAASGGLVVGVGISGGNFKCEDNGYKVPAKSLCVIVGPIGAAGVGWEGDLGFNRFHACNAKDLFGTSHGAMGTLGPVSVSGTGGGTTGGIGKSTGLGGAYIYCVTTPRHGWLLNPFGT